MIINYPDRMKRIVRITQKGDQFVGIKLIGNQYIGKNEKTIKGKLRQNRFKEVYVNTLSQGWTPRTGKISEDGNKIIVKVLIPDPPMNEIVISVQRK